MISKSFPKKKVILIPTRFYIYRKELRGIRGTLFIRGTLLSFNIISRFSIFVSLVTYVYFGNVFTARKVFIVTSYFNFLYSSVLHFWPLAISSVAEAFVSIRRVQDFLLLPENKDAILLNRIRQKGGVHAVNDELEKLLSNGEKIPTLGDDSLVGGGGDVIGNNDGSGGDVLSGANDGPDNDLIYKNNKNVIGNQQHIIDCRRMVNEAANNKSVLFKNATAGWLCENSGSNNKG